MQLFSIILDVDVLVLWTETLLLFVWTWFNWQMISCFSWYGMKLLFYLCKIGLNYLLVFCMDCVFSFSGIQLLEWWENEDNGSRRVLLSVVYELGSTN